MIGRTLDGVYQVLGTPGSGCGQSHLGRDLRTGAPVGLSFVEARSLQERPHVERLLQAACMLRALDEPHLLQVIDAGWDGDTGYVVTECVSGTPLDRMLDTRGPLPVDEAVNFVSQALQALEMMHAIGIVHRNVTPYTMLLTRNGTVKLTGFASAVQSAAMAPSSIKKIVSTTPYQAPEQAERKAPDPRSDLYSAAATLFALLAGYPPSGDGSQALPGQPRSELPRISQVRSDVPSELDELIARGLNEDPQQRFQTARHMLEALPRRHDEVAQPGPGWIPPPPYPPGAVPLLDSSVDDVPMPSVVTAPWFSSKVRCFGARLGQLLFGRRRYPDPVGWPDPAIGRNWSPPAPGSVDFGAPAETIASTVPNSGRTWPSSTPGPSRPAVSEPYPPLPSPPVGRGAGTWKVLAGGRTAPGQYNRPSALALDAHGNVYVADTRNHRIQKLSSAGQPISHWGSWGGDPGQFRSPCGVALDAAGNVYVADAGNLHIQKLSPRGEPLARWEVDPTHRQRFTWPAGVAVDAGGQVYAFDWNVEKLGPRGEILLTWELAEYDDTFLYHPRTIAADTEGNLYVPDPNYGLVEKFSPSGELLARLAVPKVSLNHGPSPHGVSADVYGNVYIVSTGTPYFFKVSPDGNILAWWGEEGSGLGQFRDAFSLAVALNGEMYVADAGNDRIQHLSPGGEVVAVWGGGGAPGQLHSPYDLALDAQGNVYVADSGNHRIGKSSPTGQPLAEWRIERGPVQRAWEPRNVAVDDEGYVYAMEEVERVVFRFTPSGELAACWRVDADGGDRITHPSGAAPTDVTRSGWRPYQHSLAELFSARDRALDREGNVYRVDANRNLVEKRSSDGRVLAFWGSTGTEPGQFQGPVSVAVDVDGNLYVADRDNHRVQKLCFNEPAGSEAAP